MNETAFCRFERRRCCCCCWCWCCYCCCCCCCWHVTSQRKRIGLSPAETRVFCFCFRPNESKANRWIVSIHFECGGPNFPIGQLSRVRCQSAIKATNSETQLPFDEFSHYKNTINETFFPAKKKKTKKKNDFAFPFISHSCFTTRSRTRGAFSISLGRSKNPIRKKTPNQKGNAQKQEGTFLFVFMFQLKKNSNRSFRGT